jgi:hypothetical protein
MAPWDEIAAAVSQRVGGERMAELRAGYLNMHVVGLSLIGRALGSGAEKTPSGTAATANRVAGVDWRRDAEVWGGMWRLSAGGITTSKKDVADGWKHLRETLK